MTLSDLGFILIRASASHVGLLLRVSDPRRAREAFARAREEALERGESLPNVEVSEREHPEGNLFLLRKGGRDA